MRHAPAIPDGPDAVGVLPLHGCVAATIEKLRNRLHAELPPLANSLSEWMDSIAPGGVAANYLSDPLMYPIIQLPGWLLQSIAGCVDDGFSSDLAYSTVNGYYHIRLLDNVQDGHGTVEGELLPAAGFFEDEFRGVYQKYFARQHPFWTYYGRFWHATSASVQKEALLRDMSLGDFREIAADKFAAAKIPLAAAAFHSGRPDLMPLWIAFCDDFARATQLVDDLFDWQDDLDGNRCTYFLSHAVRCRAERESVASFVVREGFSWGVQKLREQTMLVRDRAMKLNCRELIQYLNQREIMLAAKLAPVQEGLENLRRLQVILDNATGDCTIP